MSRLYVFPYKATSKSAIAISDALDCYRINRTNSAFTYAEDKVVINWGWGDILPREVARCRVINKPEAIALAIDKKKAFQKFIDARVKCPAYTTDKTTAKQWSNEGYRVYCRTTAHGSDGQGIVVTSPRSDSIPNASLYTRGISIRNEYRVHVVGDDIISYQKKVHTSDRTEHNPLVRTTDGGWGFEVVEERYVPDNIDDECIAAVKSLGLDFGGVDVVQSEVDRMAYVLEVNTAPHMTPYSAGKLATALKEYIG